MNCYSDTYEVVMTLLGLDPENDEQFEDEDEVDRRLYDEYGIEDTDGLDHLIKDLAKLIHVEKSPLTENVYKGFAKKGSNSWLYHIPHNLFVKEIENT
jgi:hypothetical protein